MWGRRGTHQTATTGLESVAPLRDRVAMSKILEDAMNNLVLPDPAEWEQRTRSTPDAKERQVGQRMKMAES